MVEVYVIESYANVEYNRLLIRYYGNDFNTLIIGGCNFDREITSYHIPQVPIRVDYFMKTCINRVMPTGRNKHAISLRRQAKIIRSN